MRICAFIGELKPLIAFQIVVFWRWREQTGRRGWEESEHEDEVCLCAVLEGPPDQRTRQSPQVLQCQGQAHVSKNNTSVQFLQKSRKRWTPYLSHD